MRKKPKVLEGKVAIVTGGGRGIGKAIALAYAKEGASVCCAARTLTEINATVKEIRRNGGEGLAVQTDVTDLKSVKNMVQLTVNTFGGLDILVINAGVNYDRRSVEESVPEDWVKTLEVNLIGAYYCAQTAIPYLKERGSGKIITIGSGLGHHGVQARSSYACSKSGLWMLTRVLAQELWQYNICVNELIPGPVKTAMNIKHKAKKDSVLEIESEWMKEPEDVTPLAMFLATQKDRGPTAQSFSLMRRDN